MSEGLDSACLEKIEQAEIAPASQAVESCNLKPGDRVLVHGGSGGVAHIAVQLAKHYHGAYVVSTSRNIDFVKVHSKIDQAARLSL